MIPFPYRDKSGRHTIEVSDEDKGLLKSNFPSLYSTYFEEVSGGEFDRRISQWSCGLLHHNIGGAEYSIGRSQLELLLFNCFLEDLKA